MTGPSPVDLTIDPHPLLDAACFVTRFAAPLQDVPSDLHAFIAQIGRPAFEEEAKTPIRDLLREGGFKPSGRNKPASEYVQSAVSRERLGTINAAVDACNAASFISGLPISVLDLGRLNPPLRIGIAAAATRYIFNTSGQEIRLDGLLCLFDAEGPCGNAVKDSQRTKTHAQTTQTLSVIWGTRALPDRTTETRRVYQALLTSIGATVHDLS